MIKETPRTLTMNNISFTEDDVKQLNTLFGAMDMQVLPKLQVRQSKILQNALLAGALISGNIETSKNTCTLNLTQAGRDLLGRV